MNFVTKREAKAWKLGVVIGTKNFSKVLGHLEHTLQLEFWNRFDWK